jgi:hypothetical protein
MDRTNNYVVTNTDLSLLKTRQIYCSRELNIVSKIVKLYADGIKVSVGRGLSMPGVRSSVQNTSPKKCNHTEQLLKS